MAFFGLRITMRNLSVRPSLVTMSLLCGLSLLPLNIFLPSLPNIARDLGAEYAMVALSLAGYTAASVVFELAAGTLSDRYGRRPILFICLGLFVAGSIGCALATDIWSFLACRLLQATITSGYPLSMAIVKDTSDTQHTASRISYMAMTAAFAPMVGPTLGGLVDQSFGWRAIFWLLALAGSALFLLCYFRLNETKPDHIRTFEEQIKGYKSVLGIPLFWSYSLCMAFSVGTFYALMAGAPLAAKVTLNIQPATLGLYFGTVTAGYMLGSFVSGWNARFYSSVMMILAGRIIAMFGPVIALIMFIAGADHPLAIFGPCILIGIGNGVTNPSANAGVMSVRPGLAGSASGLAGAITIAGGTAISSITASVVTEQNAVGATLCMMLATTVCGLIAASCAYVFASQPQDKPLLSDQ